MSNGTEEPRKRHRGKSRASRACEICRKQKTRCFALPNSKVCLRCQTLDLECSLASGSEEEITSSEPLSVESRLDQLDSNITEILHLLRTGNGHTYNNSPGLPPFGQPSLSFVSSPFNLYGSLVVPDLTPPPIVRLFNPQMVVHEQDIISLGLITYSEALSLLSDFQNHYNHWVSFPEGVTTSVLLDSMRRRCSLLLTVCCCVAIRYHDAALRVKVYKHLLNRLQTELYQSMLVVPQTIEFMQALTVMCIYASSLSEGEIIIDGWFYSSIALEHFITKDVLGLVMSFDGLEPVTEFDALTAYRVWNHLCLVHLVNCVMSGRTCVLDQARLDLCRRTLELTSSTNFDGRMIAEITLYYHTYLLLQSSKNLAVVEDDLRHWRDEWTYLFDQPTEQFVEMGYHYCYFVILWHWHCSKSGMEAPNAAIGGITAEEFDNCSQSLQFRMASHLLKVVDSLLVVKDDLYFACLSDQVHFCGAFAATVLSKIVASIVRSGQTGDLPKTPEEISDKLSRLALRFRTTSVTPHDLVYKFGEAILESAVSLI